MTKKELIADRKMRKKDLETRIDKLYDLFLKTKCLKERERITSEINSLEVKLSCVDQETVETRYYGLQEISTYSISKS